jgi:hypothetical protein
MKKTTMAILGFFIMSAMGLSGCSANKQAATTVNQNAESKATPPAVSQETLRNLIAAGRTVSCTYTDPAASTSGTMKVANNQVRGDFTITAEGANTTSHMISDGKIMYIWSDSQGNLGMKYDLTTLPTPGAGTLAPTGQAQPLDLDKQLDYQCSDWAADPTVFTPPANIQFQDLSSLMNNLIPKVTGIPASDVKTPSNATACATCASLTGDAKTQCTQALGCN